jgi:DNA-binding protein Fis
MSQDNVVILNLTKIIKSKDDEGNEQCNAYQEIKERFEPDFLKQLLAYTDNNKSHASRVAGFNLSTLNRKLQQYGLSVTPQLKTKSSDGGAGK